MENVSVYTIIQIILLFLSLVVFLLTLLPLFNSGYWVFRIGDFPRLQISIVALCLIIAIPLVSTFSYFIIAIEVVLLLCFIYQTIRIFPYTSIHSNQVIRSVNYDSQSSIKILISNVLIENRESEKLLELIKKYDPDLVLLAEVNDWWDKAVEELKSVYPNHLCYPLDNAYGMNFYTRLKTLDLSLYFRVQDDIPSIEADLFLESKDKIKFYGLHPRPPYPAEKKRSDVRDAELMLVGKEVKKTDLPTIVAGDLNDVAWSKTTNLFQKISGLLDSRIGRGFFNTFHAKYWFMRMPLDHVFQSKQFKLIEIKRLEYIGSDHFPIFIHLSLENNAEKEQDEPENNRKDKKQAQEKIEKATD